MPHTQSKAAVIDITAGVLGGVAATLLLCYIAVKLARRRARRQRLQRNSAKLKLDMHGIGWKPMGSRVDGDPGASAEAGEMHATHERALMIPAGPQEGTPVTTEALRYPPQSHQPIERSPEGLQDPVSPATVSTNATQGTEISQLRSELERIQSDIERRDRDWKRREQLILMQMQDLRLDKGGVGRPPPYLPS